METEEKPCKNCRWYRETEIGFFNNYLCNNPKNGMDKINGRNRVIFCNVSRVEGPCYQEGLNFELKVSPPPTPSLFSKIFGRKSC